MEGLSEQPANRELPVHRPDCPTPARQGASTALVATGGVLAFLTAHAADAVSFNAIDRYVELSLLHALVYLGAVVMVLRRGARASDLLVILAVALLLRGLAMTAPANLTTDALRYVWDGRIQAEGFNPYLYVPADERLAHLRDTVIYPDINQKETSVTVYPPLAEVIFLLVTRVMDSVEGMKFAMLGFEAVSVWAILQWLAAAGLPRERVVIYAWHPLPVWELAHSAHIDAAAVALMLLAIVAVVRGQQTAGGAWLAAAACVKYFPVVLVPALWRRWDWRAPAAFVVVVILLYSPYWIEAGPRVVGFLGGLIDNEGYSAGWGFHPIWMLRDFGLADPPAWAWLILSAIGLAGLGVYALLQRRADEVVARNLVWLAIAFVFCTSPHYPWYFAWIVPLLCLYPSPAGLAMTLLAVVLHAPRVGLLATWTPQYFLVFYLPLLVGLTFASQRWSLSPEPRARQ